MVKKERLVHIDALSGLMIIQMIYLHLERGVFDGFYLFKWLSLFLNLFMAWFAFKSGLFSNIKDLSTTILQGYKKLIKPFLFFSIIGYVVNAIFLIETHNIHWNILYSPLITIWQGGFLWGNEPLWWLITLFLVKCIYSLVNNQNRIIVFFITICSLLIANWLCLIGFDKPLWIGNTMQASFFFGMGYLLKDGINRVEVLSISIILYVVSIFIIPSDIGMVWNSLNRGNYFIAAFGYLGGCIVWYNLATLFFSESRLLSYIGKNSLIIYGTHNILLVLARIISYPIIGDNDYWRFYIGAAVLLLCLPMCILLIKRYPFTQKLCY